ncbi:uncharacterized protein LOC123666170 [Melitaea cinxia]|uniref:uncharacterized protein LOC123666170 n=1 Tax=Melitaea cinxia TaxID=113334 RepID=UPI001E2736D9|nr:uncharacterized protein LOC123666170 [Melitaea cinxia]
MAIKSDRIKVTLLILFNIIITNKCDGDFSDKIDEPFEQLQNNSSEEQNNLNTYIDKLVTEELTNTTKELEDELNLSRDNLDKISTTESVMKNVFEDTFNASDENEYDDKNGDENVDNITTYQDVTETTNSYNNADNVVSNDASEDIYRNEGSSRIDLTTQPTTRSMESSEETSSKPTDEDENSGQRNPKTETENTGTQDTRIYDKARPLPALSKSSTLKSWLEDSWLRPPAGILVPLRPLALNRALGVWNDLADEGLNVTDIVIVGYDSNGVSWRSRHNLQPTSSGSDKTVSEALSKLLSKYQGVYTDSNNDGTMRAIASAAKLVPYDSALFVVTDKGPGDPQRLPLALRALVEKRLKVYTIWTDPNHPSPESELALQDLRNISSHTEGEVLPYSLQIAEDSSSNLAAEAKLQQWEPIVHMEPRRAKLTKPDDDMFDMLLVKRGGDEATTLGVPVENGVTALRILIEGTVDHAVLYPPSDAPQIDIYNQTSISMFSPASKTGSLDPRDVFLVFPGSTLNFDTLSVLPATSLSEDVSALIGMWHLSVRCETCDYKLSVSARTDLHFYAEIVPRDVLKLRVMGPVASIRESSLVDEYGTDLAKIPFSYQPSDSDHNKDNTMADIYTDISMPSVTSSKVYVKILGRDIHGEPFVRLAGPLNQQQAEVRMGRSASIRFPESINDFEEIEIINSRMYNGKIQYNDSNLLPFERASSLVVNQRGSILTSVQVGLSTRLYGAPGDRLQLYYEVTNFREQAVRLTFRAVGQLNFLTGINPEAATIPSGQTVTVIVSLLISQNSQAGARDFINFTAFRQDEVSLSSYVYVLNTGETLQDVNSPEVRHNFQGSCMGRQGTDCAEHLWSASIFARDPVAGILRLTSSPPGLVYSGNFISGARTELMATYSANCCNPRVIVTAVDAFRNVNSYTIDISNYITGAAVAAITLGVILGIILLVVIIFSIYYCAKRRKESRELPTYNTSRNIS